MATDCIAQVTFGFERKAKPVVAAFDMPHASSDGGAVLLKSLDTQLQLTKRLAGRLVDGRQAGKVQHQTLELLRQRVFGLACGYADCNDAARLADDAIHKLLLGSIQAKRQGGPGLHTCLPDDDISLNKLTKPPNLRPTRVRPVGVSD